MEFYWWDDAIAFARELATGTAIRHRVARGADGFWAVEPVLEVCS